MREHAQARLRDLKTELEKGQTELLRVDAQRTYLQETVLRIRGAIQVLEELVTEGQPVGPNVTGSGEAQVVSAQGNGDTIR